MPAPTDAFGIVGQNLSGSFLVQEVVAEGGFSVIYRAYHEAFRAPVALKCLKIPGSMTERNREVFLEKFREEAELLFQLSASIVEVVRPLHADALILPDGRFMPFLALEWLEGDALDKVLKKRRTDGEPPFALHKITKLLAPVALALHRGHNLPTSKGLVSIVHCDLKAANIFLANVANKQKTKILDFGIARVLNHAECQISADDLAAFTPHCAAPEQWEPKVYGQPGPWTDVFALALLVVEMLIGKRPIKGDMKVMLAICVDRNVRPVPSEFGVQVPAGVEAALRKALAVDPVDRTQDVETFWTELELGMALRPTFRNEPSISPPVQERLTPVHPSIYERPTTEPVINMANLVPTAPSAFPEAAEGGDPFGEAMDLPVALGLPSPPTIASVPPTTTEIPALDLPASAPVTRKLIDTPPLSSISSIELDLPAMSPRPPTSAQAIVPPSDRVSGIDIDSSPLALELMRPSSPPAPPQPPRPAVVRHPTPSARTSFRPREDSAPAIGDLVRAPLIVLGLGAVLIAADFAFRSAVTSLPVRPLWLGGAIATIAIAMAIARLAGSDSDDRP